MKKKERLKELRKERKEIKRQTEGKTQVKGIKIGTLIIILQYVRIMISHWNFYNLSFKLNLIHCIAQKPEKLCYLSSEGLNAQINDYLTKHNKSRSSDNLWPLNTSVRSRKTGRVRTFLTYG